MASSQNKLSVIVYANARFRVKIWITWNVNGRLRIKDSQVISRLGRQKKWNGEEWKIKHTHISYSCRFARFLFCQWRYWIVMMTIYSWFDWQGYGVMGLCNIQIYRFGGRGGLKWLYFLGSFAKKGYLFKAVPLSIVFFELEQSNQIMVIGIVRHQVLLI